MKRACHTTVNLWKKHSGVGGRKQNSLNVARGGRHAVRKTLGNALEDVYDYNNNSNNQRKSSIPNFSHAKLLNWRTSQVNVPPQENKEGIQNNDNNAIVTTEEGKIIMTGDWCAESSYEGCYRAATAASNLVLRHLFKK